MESTAYLPYEYNQSIWVTSPYLVPSSPTAKYPHADLLTDLHNLNQDIAKGGEYLQQSSPYTSSQCLDPSVSSRDASFRSSTPQTRLTESQAISICERRRCQNRDSQRAFRQRKAKHVQDLEQKLVEMKQKYWALEKDHADLNVAYNQMHEIINALKSSKGSKRLTEGD